MEVELAEVRDFLAAHAPFDSLPGEVLDDLPRRCTLRYARRGSEILRAGSMNDRLFVVRSGAVDITDDGQVVDRVGAGGSFGMSAVVEHVPTRYAVTAREDTLLITLPQAAFDELSAAHPVVALHFAATHHERIKAAIGQLHQARRGSAVLRTTVRDMLRRQPVTAGPGATVREAAQAMTDAGFSALLVVEEGRLVGIVTDRDLRRRVVAAGLDPSRPVRDIMTEGPVTVSADALALEVMLEMTGRNLHHLPVLEVDGSVLGLVTTTDLVRLEQASPVYLVTDLARQQDVAGVVRLAREVPAVVTQLVAEDATAADIGRVTSALLDAVAVRLLQLAEQALGEELGPAPGGWCWTVLGSAAREELGLSGDQDHALVLADDADPADPWWAALAERVTAGLEAAGLPRCDGGVMATNPRWRMRRRDWATTFADWSRAPEPEAVLGAAIFYDMRPLHGDTTLVERLRAEVLPRASRSELLLTHLAAQATRMRPPIGFFRGFVLEDSGAHRDTLDVKRGIAAVVQIARVHALRAGSGELGTAARLAAARAAGVISAETARDLSDALELMSYLRLRHQADQLRAGERPDNHLSPERLGSLDRRHLRDAFAIVRTAQQGMALRVPRVG
ncbi:putative nucleotidyltransferase substrate binding domain-containing protein [Ornithinimicrobium tianjinense]|uniref:Histidine kinase n=1 Tax=Ornithinimicrobium tianjinense TaxID=1195761 RepID=A0A917BR80_9MICO|nr:putative nucleotidyltransferase substrate binding domain-containing protein [Ornithinimicrobium tianjinense]GGF55755.1 histidine kinase [Ornithinimicrobium tianjinense]